MSAIIFCALWFGQISIEIAAPPPPPSVEQAAARESSPAEAVMHYASHEQHGRHGHRHRGRQHHLR
jgi:hypothetical protein